MWLKNTFRDREITALRRFHLRRRVVSASLVALTGLMSGVAPATAGGAGTRLTDIDRPADHGTSGPVAAVRIDRPAPTPAAPNPRVVGSVTSWGIYERGHQMSDVPADDLTYLNYAFANVVDGRCELGDPWADVERPLPTDDPDLDYRGNFNQLAVLKAEHPHLQTLISVGGSTWSGGFSTAASSPTRRTKFVASCIDLMSKYGFDGIDIDWEYPGSHGSGPSTIHDRTNFTALLAEFRTQLGTNRLLTIAGPAGAPMMADIDIAAISGLVDWVNVMGYDFAGAWSPRTGHNAALYVYPGIEDPTFTVDSAIRRWIDAGLAPHKVNLGLSFYGRGFGGVADRAPGASFRSIPAGTTQAGQYDYADLIRNHLPSMTVGFDAAARVPFAFDPSTGVWISFDDERSIEEKARYSVLNDVGGVMVWELSNDADGRLLGAARRGLGLRGR